MFVIESNQKKVEKTLTNLFLRIFFKKLLNKEIAHDESKFSIIQWKHHN
jgi:hypothetical protein